MKLSDFSTGAELEDRHTMKFLSRFQFSRRETRMVRRVRKMLRFQANGKSPVIDAAFFSRDRPVEEIPRIELHTWFGGQHPQNSSSGWLIYLGCFGQLAGRMIQHE